VRRAPSERPVTGELVCTDSPVPPLADVLATTVELVAAAHVSDETNLQAHSMATGLLVTGAIVSSVSAIYGLMAINRCRNMKGGYTSPRDRELAATQAREAAYQSCSQLRRGLVQRINASSDPAQRRDLVETLPACFRDAPTP